MRYIVSVTHADLLQRRITQKKASNEHIRYNTETWKVQETDSATWTFRVIT